jgi:hypothetical protein
MLIARESACVRGEALLYVSDAARRPAVGEKTVSATSNLRSAGVLEELKAGS